MSMPPVPQCTCNATLGIDGCLIHGPQSRLLKPFGAKSEEKPAKRPSVPRVGVLETMEKLAAKDAECERLNKRVRELEKALREISDWIPEGQVVSGSEPRAVQIARAALKESQ